MNDIIDYDKLRDDLLDYFGTAKGFFPYAEVDLITIENCSKNELIAIALKNNFDLSNYEKVKRI